MFSLDRALFAAVAITAAVTFGGSAGATPFPGPDAAGYTGTTIANNLRDISSTGTYLGLSDDQVSGPISLGFSFTFYGNTYSQAYVSSNGFLTFNNSSANGCCTGQPLPSSGNPTNLIAGLWADLNNPNGNIRYETVGAPGSQEFIVGFYDNQFFYNNGPNTFEMILHEGSNNIELQYGSLAQISYTVSSGIENSSGTAGLQIYRGYADFTEQRTLQNQGFLITQTEVPEPSTLSLVGSAIGILGLFGWRSKKKKAEHVA